MDKETFLSIQEKLWDISPTYPDELSKTDWLVICGEFYDDNLKLFIN